MNRRQKRDLKNIVKTILLIIFFIILIKNCRPAEGYATFNEWCECTGNAPTKANYEYYVNNVPKIKIY